MPVQFLTDEEVAQAEVSSPKTIPELQRDVAASRATTPENVGTRIAYGLAEQLPASLYKLFNATGEYAGGLSDRFLGTNLGAAPAEFATRARERERRAIEVGEQIGGGAAGDAAQQLAAIAGQSAAMIPFVVGGSLAAPLIGAAPGAAALGIGSALSGLQSLGGIFDEANQAGIAKGLSEKEAANRAYIPATIAGLTTALITRAFGNTGTEALLKGFNLASAKGFLKHAARQAGFEASEESLDELAQGVLAKMSYDPNRSIEDIVKNVAFAGGAGGLLGGGFHVGGGLIGGVARAADTANEFIQMGREAAPDRVRYVGQREGESAGDFIARRRFGTELDLTPRQVEVPQWQGPPAPPVAPTPTIEASIPAQPTPLATTINPELALAQTGLDDSESEREARALATTPRQPVSTDNLEVIARDVLRRMEASASTGKQKRSARLLRASINSGSWETVSNILHLSIDDGTTAMPSRFRHLAPAPARVSTGNLQRILDNLLPALEGPVAETEGSALTRKARILAEKLRAMIAVGDMEAAALLLGLTLDDGMTTVPERFRELAGPETRQGTAELTPEDANQTFLALQEARRRRKLTRNEKRKFRKLSGQRRKTNRITQEAQDQQGIPSPVPQGQPTTTPTSPVATGQKMAVERVFYRGTEPGETRRIAEPFTAAKGLTFVARTEKGAKQYGQSVELVIAKPEARILDDRSSDFWKVIGRKRPANGYIGSAGRKGESLVDVVNDAINKAKSLGYDAISIGDADIGTVIINENAFRRGAEAATTPAKPVATAQKMPWEMTVGELADSIKPIKYNESGNTTTEAVRKLRSLFGRETIERAEQIQKEKRNNIREVVERRGSAASVGMSGIPFLDTLPPMEKQRRIEAGRATHVAMLAKNFFAKESDAVALVHQASIEVALKQGKLVPAEVLADYPDLKPTPAATVAKVAGGEKERIVAAALRHMDGSITQAASHGLAINVAEESGKLAALVSQHGEVGRFKHETGFITSTGRFVSPGEAGRISGVQDFFTTSEKIGLTDSPPAATGAAQTPQRITPAKLTKEIASEPGYVYHATNAERLQEIADSGKLKTHRPDYGTEQDVWPDGSSEKRSYFSSKASVVWQFAPEEGKSVVIRTKGGADFKSESTGDIFSRRPVPISKLEYLGEDGAWHPVSELGTKQPVAPPPAAETGAKGKPPVEPGQGGVPYYQKLGASDAVDPARKRMRSVPQNFKLAYLDGWYEAKKTKPAPTPVAPVTLQISEEASEAAIEFADMVDVAAPRTTAHGVPYDTQIATLPIEEQLLRIGLGWRPAGEVVKGKKTKSGRPSVSRSSKLTHRFALMRRKKNGRIYVMPVRVVPVRVKYQKAQVQVPRMGVPGSTKNTSEVRTLLESGNYELLGTVLFLEPRETFPVSFDQETYEAIDDHLRSQLFDASDSIDAITEASSNTLPPSFIEAVNEGKAPASGIPEPMMRDLYQAVTAEIKAGNLGVDILVRNNLKLFEDISEIVKRSGWDFTLLLHRLESRLENRTNNKTYEEFEGDFDPTGQADKAAAKLASIPKSIATAARARRNAEQKVSEPVKQKVRVKRAGVAQPEGGTKPSLSESQRENVRLDVQSRFENFSSPVIKLIWNRMSSPTVRARESGPALHAEDGEMWVNAEELEKTRKSFGDDYEAFNAWVEASVSEEIIHLAVQRQSNSGELQELAESLTRQEKDALQGLRGRVDESDIQLAQEYVRIIIQDRLLNSTTELTIPERIRHIVRGILERLVNFLKSAFTSRPDDDIAKAIVSRAVTALRSDALIPNRGAEAPAVGSVSNFTFNRKASVVERAKEAKRVKAGREAVQRIRSAASTQAGAVPTIFKARLMQHREATNPVARATFKKLRFLLDYAELSKNPQQLAALPRNTPEEIKQADMEAAAVLQHHRYTIHRRLGRYRASVKPEQENLLNELKHVTAINESDLVVTMLNTTTDDLVNGYKQRIRNEKQTASRSGNLTAARENILNRMQQRLTDQQPSRTAMNQALESISDAIPVTMLEDPDITAEDINEWALGSNVVQSQTVRDFLLLPKQLAGTEEVMPSVLSQDEKIKESLLALKDVKTRRQTAKDAIKEFDEWFSQNGKPTAVTPARFARAYARMAVAKKRHMEIVKRLSKKIDQADTKLLSTEEAISFIEEMLKHPEYRDNINYAIKNTNTIIQRLMLSNEQTGMTDVLGPLDGEYRISYWPDKEHDNANYDNMTRLVNEIDQWLGDPEVTHDPVMEKAWAEEKTYIQRFMLPARGLAENGGFTDSFIVGADLTPGGYRVNVDMWEWLNRASGNYAVDPHNLLHRIGGRAAQEVLRKFQAANLATEPMKNTINHKEHGIDRTQVLVTNAMKSHGINDTSPNALRLFDFQVLEKVASSYQNDLQRHYKVGDTLPNGEKVTQEDILAVESMHKFGYAIKKHVSPDENGGYILMKQPLQIEEQYGRFIASRKAVASGRYDLPRTSSHYAKSFAEAWTAESDPVKKLELLDDPVNFELAVKGQIDETNPEYTGWHKYRLQKHYDVLRDKIRKGEVRIPDMDSLVAWLMERLEAEHNSTLGMSDEEFAKSKKFRFDTDNHEQEITNIIAGEINEEAIRYLNTVIKSEQKITEHAMVVRDSGTKPISHNVTAEGSFKDPRNRMVVPSTYYSYTMTEKSKMHQYVSHARLEFELRQLEALKQLHNVLQRKLDTYDAQTAKMQSEGVKVGKARKVTRQKSRQEQLEGETLFSIGELRQHVNKLKRVVVELNRLASRQFEEYKHPAIGMLQEVGSIIQSQVLASETASSTNLFGGTLFAQPMMRALRGDALSVIQVFKGGKDMIRMAMSGTAAVLRNHPKLDAMFRRNPKAWGEIAAILDSMMERYMYASRLQKAANINSTYDLKSRLEMNRRLRTTGGRIEFDDKNILLKWMNAITSAPGMSQYLETVKSLSPRVVDNTVNIMAVEEAVNVLNQLKAQAMITFAEKERQAERNGTGDSWRDFTKKENLLTPQELGVRNHKSAEEFRQTFNSIGLLDQYMLDYYDRAKGLNPDERAAIEMIPDPGDMNSYTMEYVGMINLGLESNRAPAFRGGSTRPNVWMFFGYVSNLLGKLSQISRSHSKDVGVGNLSHGVMTIFGVMLTALVASVLAREPFEAIWNRVFGRRKSRPNLINVVKSGSVSDATAYAFMSMARMLPYVGGIVNRTTDGIRTGNFFDATSLFPIASFASDTISLPFRIGLSHDPLFPIADWTRRWTPPLTPIINRLPFMTGDVLHKNAMAALRASAPGGMELRPFYGGSVAAQTPLSPIIRSLVGAAYDGDMGRVNQLFNEAVAMKGKMERESGRFATREELEASVIQSIRSRVPTTVFNSKPTEREERVLLSRMTDQQRQDYMGSRRAFNLIEAVTGKNFSFVTQGDIATKPTFSGATRTRARRGRRGSGLRSRRSRGRSSSFASTRSSRGPSIGKPRLSTGRIRLRSPARLRF